MTQLNKYLEMLFSTGGGRMMAITSYNRSEDNAPKSYFLKKSNYISAANLIDKLSQNKKLDIYIRPTILKDQPKYGRGKRTDTKGSNVLWVDLDISKGRTLGHLLESLVKFKFPPSMVIKSGRGIHAYWKLDSFCDNLEAIESKNKWLSKQLGGDNCWAVTQILRPPNTINTKNNEFVGIIESFPAATGDYAINEFPSVREDYTYIDTGFEAEPLPLNFLNEISDSLEKRITHGDGAQYTESQEIDRSNNDWYVALSLIEAGFAPGQVLSVFLNESWFVHSKVKEHGIKYALYTIAKAVDKHKENVIKQQKAVCQLDGVFNEILFYTDDTGKPKKRRLLRGSELVDPTFEYLKKDGIKFYYDVEDSSGYITTPEGNVLEAETRNNEYMDWIQEISGFVESETEHKMLKNGLASKTRSSGIECKVTPWSYYDADSNAYYVMQSSTGRKVLKFTATGAEEVPNGQDNILIRSSSLTTNDIKLDSNVDVNNAMKNVWRFLSKYLAVRNPAREIITAYTLLAPISHNLGIQTLPILHFTGRAGSGKTQTLMSLSALLHGSSSLLNTTPAAGYRVASSEIILPFDDYEKLSDEAKQFVLTACTGIMRQKSGLGVNDIVNQKVHILLAMTSIASLEEEALKRRAISIWVNQNFADSKINYKEDHYKSLLAIRSEFFNAYGKFVVNNVHKLLQRSSIDYRRKEIEAKIKVGMYRGLATFLSFAYEIYKEFADIVEIKDRCSVIEWLEELNIVTSEDENTPVETTEDNEFLSIIQTTFEAYNIEGGTIDRMQIDKQNSAVLNKSITTLKDKNFRLNFYRDENGNRVLEGTSTQWVTTINSSNRAKVMSSATKFGNKIKQFVEQEFVFNGFDDESNAVESGGYRFSRLRGVGEKGSNLGWKIVEVN